MLICTLGIGLYGIHAYFQTPIEAYPDVTNLMVTVIAQMPGLAPEEVERQLTIPLERVLNGMPDLVQLRSESHFGLAIIILVFNDNADGFRSRSRVSERISTADLPPGVIPSLGPDATPLGKVFTYRIVGKGFSATDRRFEQDWSVAPTLKQVPGVADVVSFGGFRKEFHVEVDPSRLLAHDLTLKEVNDALMRSNQNIGGGFLVQGDQGLVIRGVGYLRNPGELLEVVLRNEGGTPVTVRDIARVTQSYAPRLGGIGYGEEIDSVEGYVLLRRGENPSVVLAGIEDKVRQLNKGVLPPGMAIETFYNRMPLVNLTLETVRHNLFLGALLVASVVWLFLRSLRCSLIVASIIPLALLGAFIGLHLLKLPANLISMGAIDFGILVDAGVVLAENVLHGLAHERPKTTQERLSLIVRTAVEVSRPTFFAMAIVGAALIPIFSLERIEGRIFRPMAMTYAFAITSALILSLTFVPAVCALLLRVKDASTASPEGFDRFRDKIAGIVDMLLGKRRLVFIGLGALLLIGIGIGARLGTEFLPELDEGDLLVFAEMPPSISLDEGAILLREMRRKLEVFPEVKAILSEQGRPEDGTDNEAINLGKIHVHLLPKDKWRPGLTRRRLMDAMRATLLEIVGVNYNFSQPIRDAVEESVSGVRGKVVLKLFGRDLDASREILRQAKSLLSRIPGIVDLDLYRDATAPQVVIALDRPALARAGITVSDALDLAETALGGRIVTSLWEGERPVDVRVRLPRVERSDLNHVSDILVPSPSGARIPLRDLAEIKVASGRASILREDNRRSMALKFNVEGRDMGSVVKDAQAAIAASLKPPPGHYFQWNGEFENQARAMKRLQLVVPVSLLIVLFLLYSAVGSLRGALAILFVAPFGLTGGLLALFFMGVNLSVSAAVGFIALLGLVCLDALLFVAATDRRLQAGEELRSAVINGVRDRFRAQVMTTLLAMLGLFPMAVSHAVGAEIQRPFAIVIIGGLAVALVVTIFALPVIYRMFARPPPANDEFEELGGHHA